MGWNGFGSFLRNQGTLALLMTASVVASSCQVRLANLKLRKLPTINFSAYQISLTPEITSGSTSKEHLLTVNGVAPFDQGMVLVYVNDETCSGQAASAGIVTAKTFTFGLDTSASTWAGDGIKNLAIKMVPSGRTGSCELLDFDYTLDTTAPADPLITQIAASPTNNSLPVFAGTIEAGASIELFASASCTGTAFITSSAADFAMGVTPGAPLADGLYTLTAKVADSLGNTSSCKPIASAWRVDTIAPAAPLVGSTTPASPSSATQPQVVGTTEASASVTLYTTSNCTPSSQSGASTLADVSGAFSIQTSALASGTHTFYAQSTDAAGNISPCSSSGITYVRDSSPNAPSGLAATPAANGLSIALSWLDNSTNETGFELQRSLDGVTYAALATPAANSTSYNDSPLSKGTTYYYRIRANNAVGSSAWVAISATTPSNPAAPSNLTLNPAANGLSITFTWTDNSANETGFEIQRGTDGTSYSALTNPAANTTSFTDNTVSPGLPYYYRIRATNAAGNSIWGTANTTTPNIPTAPSGLSLAAAANGASVTVSWTDNSNNETGFELERGPDGVSYSALTTPATNLTSYTDNTVSTATTYFYRLRAVNAVGATNWISSSTTTPSIPAAPTSLAVALLGATSLRVTWTDNSTTETGFKLERSLNNISWSQVATPAANVTSYDDAGLTEGQTYYYRARATNAVGDSAYTASASSTPGIVPSAPLNLTATPGNGLVTLSWTAPTTGTTPMSYRVMRGLTTPFNTYLDTVTVGTTYTDTTAANGTTYYYLVRAQNAVGTGPDSNTVNATPMAPPAAPSALQGNQLSSTSIRISWTDNSSNESGFAIDRSTDGTNFSALTTVSANVTSFDNTGLTIDQVYYYRVRAVNAGGNSAWSNTLTIYSAGPAYRLAFTGPTSITAEACVLKPVAVRSAGGISTTVAADTLVRLDTTGEGTFFTNSSCSSTSMVNVATIPAGATQVSLYYSAYLGPGSATLTASTPSGLISATESQTVIAPTPHTYAIIGPRAATINRCAGPYRLEIRNAGGLPQKSVGGNTATLSPSAGLSAYSDSACTSSIATLSVSDSQSSASFYLRTATPSVYSITASGGGVTNAVTEYLSVNDQFTRVDLFAGVSATSGSSDGVGAAARFNNPSALATDGTSIYVVDRDDDGNSLVRRFNPATSTVSTPVGNSWDRTSSPVRDGAGPTIRMYNIQSIASDTNYLYLGGYGCIRRVSIATSYVKSIVGLCENPGNANGIGSSARMGWITSLALDSAQSKLYASNGAGLWEVDLSTMQSTLVAGDYSSTGDLDGIGTAARFDISGGGLSIGSNGDVYIGVYSKIKSLNRTTYEVTTLQSNIYQSQHIHWDGTYLWGINGSQPNYILRAAFTPSYSQSTYFGSNSYVTRDGTMATGSFFSIRGMTKLGSDLYIVEQNSHTLRRVNISGNSIATVAGVASFDFTGTTSADLKMRDGVLLGGGNGNLYLIDTAYTCAIRKINTSTGAVSHLAGPTTLPYSADGCYTTVTDGAASAVRFATPKSGLVDGDSLYVVDGSRIRKVSTIDGTTSTVVGQANSTPPTDGVGTAAILNNPGPMAKLGNYVYFADYNAVRRFSTTTFTVETIAGAVAVSGFINGAASASRFNFILGLASDGVNLYIADTYSVRKLDVATMTVSLIAGSGSSAYADASGAAARFGYLMAMTINPTSTHLYVRDLNHGIRMVALASGDVSTLLGRSGSRFDRADIDGSLDAADLMPIATTSGKYPSMYHSGTELYYGTRTGIRYLH